MHVLLTGADGFIGGALADALAERGHALTLCTRDVAGASRRWPQHRVIPVDFALDHRVEDWIGRLAGIDAVVNAVGIFRESGWQTFAAIHMRAPMALFEASVAAGVRRVVQVSALGADAHAVSGFLRSKHAADVALLRLPLQATVVRPSLVFAPEGASAAMFLRLAALPLIPLPGDGTQCVQPIHRDDLVAAIVACLEAPTPPAILNAVGPEPVPVRDYLRVLRSALGLGTARFVPIPQAAMRVAASIGGSSRNALLDRDAMRMLDQGNCADSRGIQAVLGRSPRPPTVFIERERAPALRRWTRLAWLLPLLRTTVALVWIATGVVSLGVYPIADSLALLERVGLTGTSAIVALIVAALLDLALGVATLWPGRRRWLYAVQMGVIVAYTVIITAWLPEFWLHPYGPVLKNLPLLAALWLLYEMDRDETP